MKPYIQIITFFIFFSCNSSNSDKESKASLQNLQPTSSVMLYLKQELPIELNQCSTHYSNDTLFIKLSDASFLYELEILKTTNTVFSHLTQLFGITDSSYRPIVFTPIKQQIRFDKSNYKNGDNLKAKVSFLFSAYHSWSRIYTDTVQVQGLIYTTLNSMLLLTTALNTNQADNRTINCCMLP